ncbi:MAG: hypothetical protein LC662_05010 [Rhodothermaceae bacterium]|nr:hypothetical protein [Rhodothermaceae bacterium]
MKPLLFILALLLGGCSIFGTDDKSGTVYLRIENAGEVDFLNVKVSFTGDLTSFGAVTAGETSEYRPFDVAYHYGYIEVETPESVYKKQPIDYVGESPLKRGNYTYSLKIEDNQLLFTFKK